MIMVEELHKQYCGSLFKKNKKALRGVSMHVDRGSVFGIVGPNGAGKSTLLKILLGLVKASSGYVALDGLNPNDFTCRKNLGYLPENPCLYDHLSVKDHLVFIARIANFPPKKQQIELVKF